MLAIMMSIRTAMKEISIAADPWSQYFLNLSHVLFHLACELPFLPTSPMNAAAFAAPDIKATVNCLSKNTRQAKEFQFVWIQSFSLASDRYRRRDKYEIILAIYMQSQSHLVSKS